MTDPATDLSPAATRFDAIAAAARAAYGAAQPVRTPRAAERDILSSVTARLVAATRADDFPRLAAALHDNNRLWARLAADVAGPGNGLPAELRARLFYLAEFTATHAARVLAGEADAQALIDVNGAVIRGLAPPPAPAPVPQTIPVAA